MPLGFLLLLPAFNARAEFSDFRGLWVSRYEYSMSDPSSVEQIMANAASAGFTDVMFQVRGQSDAYYNSSFEPRSERLTGRWDPLDTAVTAAHSNGLKLHAWVNTMPLWRGSSLPDSSNHPYYNTDPSFRRQDIDGNYESPTDGTAYPTNGEYASVNPILPEVHDHINNVITDIASNYEVDGVHLDYIRWIGSQTFDTLPHDAESHQLFLDSSGLDAGNSRNSSTYRNFIKDRITDLVGSLKTSIDSVETNTGRSIDLSAAVWRDPDVAESDRLQDYRTWMENELLDIVMPMIYLTESNDHLFLPNLLNTLDINSNTRVAPGLGVYLHDDSSGGVPLTISQLQRLYDNGADGASMFSYSSLFGSDPLASERRTAISVFYDSLIPESPTSLSPNTTILVDFELDEGTFDASPTLSGSTTGVNSATADRTDAEAHLGQYSQQLVIDGAGSQNWFVRHLSGVGSPAANTPIPTEGFFGFWLKTDAPGLTVAPVFDDPGTGERGVEQAILSDGEWHLYEWDLSDEEQWTGWVGGDGTIDGTTATLDSIQFFGTGDAVIYLDTIAFNPFGSLVIPAIEGDYNGDGLVNLADYDVWKESFGSATDLRADGNGDSVVNLADYVVWRDRADDGTTAIAGANVPEPQSLALATLLITLVAIARQSHSDHSVTK
ncbi:family 10 glycosylhydrolase [Aeoliella mucimassa]|nr:family 10 glycosylhydrolase [Aeoliella mucimassa]